LLPLENRATSTLNARSEERNLSVSSGRSMGQHVKDRSITMAMPVACHQIVQPPQQAEKPVPSGGIGSNEESENMTSSSKSCSLHERLVQTARALDKALTSYWRRRGLHVTVADHWSYFFDEAVADLGYTSSQDGVARLALADLEKAMRKRFVQSQTCDELVASGVTRAELRAVFDAADTRGLGRLTAFDWQMRLYKLEFDSLANATQETQEANSVPLPTECSFADVMQAASSLLPETSGGVQNSSAEDGVAKVCAHQCAEDTSRPRAVSERGISGTASFVAQMDTPSRPAGIRQEPGSSVKRRRTGKSKPLHANEGRCSAKDHCSHPGVSLDEGNQVAPKPPKEAPGTGAANHATTKTSSRKVHSNTAELLELKSNTNSRKPNSNKDTSQHKERGHCVAVIGDGWGSGDGGYQAIVTEADDLTFTVVIPDPAGRWEETHVLRSCCILLEGEFDDFGANKMQPLRAAASDHHRKLPVADTPRPRKPRRSTSMKT